MNTFKHVVACAVGLFIAMAATWAQAEIVTFDAPGYVAGQVPPAPWWQEYDNTTDYAVGSGVGYGGTQGLLAGQNGQWAGMTYQLMTPLTSNMGAVTLTIMFKPAGGQPSGTNFMSFGGMQVGRGSMKYGTSTYLGMIFRKVSGSNGIYGPGGGTYGSYMGGFATDQWYEMTFELNAAWDTMTLHAGPVGGSLVSMAYAWDGGDITSVWVLSTQAGNPAVYDNLNVGVPEPAGVGMLILGVAAAIRRR